VVEENLVQGRAHHSEHARLISADRRRQFDPGGQRAVDYSCDICRAMAPPSLTERVPPP